MSAPSSVMDGYRAAFDVAAAQLAGQSEPWLQHMREQAFARFTELGFPTPRDEDWKYTRVTPIAKRAFRTLSPSDERGSPPSRAFSEHAGHRLVFIDGRFEPQFSQVGGLPPGAIVTNLRAALTRHSARLQPYLGRCAKVSEHSFAALNTAFLNDGAYIFLPTGAAIPETIQLVFCSSAQGQDAHINPRLLIVAEADSEATVVESFVSDGEFAYFTNAITEVVLGKGAHLEHYKHQEESAKAFHMATLQVQQESRSRLASHSFSVGGALVRSDINTTLDGESAECTLNGLYMVGGRQHVDFHTRIEHVAPGSTSREHYKGIISGRARAVFNGQVYVHPHAQKTDAQQSNDNLLLSREAEVDTKPQLEIYADDVKCAHGATVGQLDENMVYYLRSRGIDDNSARGLLTYGFAQQVLESMQNNAVRERLHEVLLRYLPNTEQIKGLVK
jgi:Fe-S cluster assembly protein SufD